jgi:hypothetical protein
MAPPRTMRLAGRLPGRRTGPASWALVIRYAQCSDSGLDPDQWFPVSADPGQARQEAAAAIAICATCPVRGHCLTLSLQHWDIGQHGVWGGLVAADRARLRRRARPHRGWAEEPAMGSLGASQRAVPRGHL